MRTLLKRSLIGLLAALVLFAGLIAYLAITTPGPREAAGWERWPDLPNPRGEFAAALGARVDDCPGGEPICPGSPVRLFVAGGIGGLGRTVDLVDLFDPETRTWQRGPSLPEKRHHLGAAGWGGLVYVSGGASSATDWTPRANLWALSPDADRWQTLPSMPEARMGHRMVALDGRLYVIGGRGETSNVLIYEISERRWRIGAEMPAPRDHLAVAVDGARIHAIGGRDTDLVARVDVYDTAADAWREGPALPSPMSAMAAGMLDDGIHVVGGEDPATFGGRVIDRHYHLLPGAGSWQDASLPIVATHGSASAVLTDRLIVIGGARRQGALSPLGWTGIVQVYAGSR